jgi:hypothetical protein
MLVVLVAFLLRQLYKVLVGFGCACAVRPYLFRLITTQKSALRAPRP